MSGYVLANDTDADGHALAAALLSSTANGTVSLGANGFFLYTPATNFSGYDSFDYAVADGYGGTDVGTVWITVIAVNDPPVVPPYTFTTDEDESYGGVIPGTDPDGDVLIYTVSTGPTHGTVVLNPDGSFTYTPDENYHGTDEFGYTVSDGQGGSAAGTVTFTITSVNDAPVGVGGSTTSVGCVNGSVSGNVMNFVTDADGDVLSAVLLVGPVHGTLVFNADGTFTYTPAAGFLGSDGFTYRVSDGHGGTVTSYVELGVTNRPPAITGNTGYATTTNTAISIAWTNIVSDADGDTLTVSGHTQGSHGSVGVSGTSLVYTPETGFEGTDTFAFTVSDGRGGTVTRHGDDHRQRGGGGHHRRLTCARSEH